MFEKNTYTQQFSTMCLAVKNLIYKYFQIYTINKNINFIRKLNKSISSIQNQLHETGLVVTEINRVQYSVFIDRTSKDLLMLRSTYTDTGKSGTRHMSSRVLASVHCLPLADGKCFTLIHLQEAHSQVSMLI